VSIPPYVDLDPAMLRAGIEVTRLLFVRHGQQESTPEGVVPQGWLDAELTLTGLAQAAAVASLLAAEPLAAVACSDMRRARHTAEEIASRHAHDATVFPELAEIDVYADLPADVWPADHMGAEAWEAAHAQFARDPRWEVFPFGETGPQLRARVGAVVDGLVAKHPGETIAVVCHGGAINAYLARFLGVAVDMFFLPAHCSVTRVLASADGRRVVESLNERHHLDGLVTY
jgi:broad specificity phosphatase PhoE